MDLYLTTHPREKYLPPAGFDPAIPASKRLQTYALESSTIGTGENFCQKEKY
jgi:hypothetical protein